MPALEEFNTTHSESDLLTILNGIPPVKPKGETASDNKARAKTINAVAIALKNHSKSKRGDGIKGKAGHALSSRGETLERHYFQAEAIAKAAPNEPTGMLKSIVLKQQKQIADLQELVLMQQRMIEELNSEAEQNATSNSTALPSRNAVQANLP